MILMCSQDTPLAHETKHLAGNPLTVYWCPGSCVSIPVLDWQVISSGLLRGKMCYTDTPSTSTDPLVSLGL